MGFVGQSGIYDWLRTMARWQLVSLHYCYIEFANAAPPFSSMSPYWFEYRFLYDYFVF